MTKWYQVKEKAAGDKRLICSWYIYKIFGKKAINLIAFFVTLFTFVLTKEIRKYSKKYLEIISPLTGIKPTLINQFRHCLSYSYVLTDRIEIFSNNFDTSKLKFENQEVKDEIYSYFSKEKGAVFLCSHVGNTDVLRTLFINDPTSDVKVNVFLSENQCKTFNNFMKKIAKKVPIETYAVEKTGIDTSIRLKDSLDKGNIAFIAGDRISQNQQTKTFEATLFGKKVDFPIGSFKLAQLMEVQIYFISALKESDDTYTIYLEKNTSKNLEDIEKAYVKFIEKMALKAPLQFYHFYDLFKD